MTTGSDEVARDADTMRAEVTQFLEAVASTDDGERRRYERISGNGEQVAIYPRGGSEMHVVIVDLSRGGVSLRCDWRADPGTEVPVELPGAGGQVIGRVVHTGNGTLALAFRHDESMLRRVDQTLAFISAKTRAAA